MNEPPDDARSSLQRGITLFNDAHFWHAHEAWEELWLVASGDEKRFLQGLIQLAAAYHHVQRGTFRGALRLFDAAFAKLSPFPNGSFGITRDEVIRIAMEHQKKIARGEQIDGNDFPKFG